MKQKKIESEELKVIRQINNQDLVNLEKQNHLLQTRIQSHEQDFLKVKQEKANLLDYIEKIQAKNKIGMEQVSNFSPF